MTQREKDERDRADAIANLHYEIREWENLASSPDTNDPTRAREMLADARRRLAELKGKEAQA